jgi:large conductance mechanosensitive channel
VAETVVHETVLQEFSRFLKETNALALAMAVVIGGAVQKLVTAIVADVFMPLLGMILPSGEWRAWKIALRGDAALAIGDVLGAALDFIIIAVVLYFVVGKLLKVQPPIKAG